MRKALLIFSALLTVLFSVQAQQRQISGKVLDKADGQPLIGASVNIAGATQGAITDVNGNFSLAVSAPGDVTLVVKYLGYKEQRISVTANTNQVTISMEPDATMLSEVVAVGYSTVQRRDLTGSVSSVGAKQLKDIPLSSAAEALTGKLAGVQVTTTEGSPGAEVQIRVRGGGSITQDNSPIYIVDGIQIENALSVISPQDIASVDVLKDASTTAIYGARGANGVVLITTKGGKAGKTIVSYNGSAGFRGISKTMDVLSPYEFIVWQYERSRGSQTDRDNFARNYGSTWDTLNVYRNTPAINWQDRVFGRQAFYQNHNFVVSGGSDKTTFNFSATANDEEGILLQSGFRRYLTNFKFDHTASDKFRIGLTARYSDQKVRGAGTTASGTRTTNRLRHSIIYRPFELPTRPAVDEFDEDYYLNSNQIQNPVILTQAEYRNAPSSATNISGYLSLQILEGLSFKTTLGFDNAAGRQELFFSKLTPTARNFAALPVASISNTKTTTLNNSNVLQYVKKGIRNLHDLDFLIGQEFYQTISKLTSAETRYYPSDISPEKALANLSLGSPPAGASQPFPTSFEAPPNRILSFFGRVNYAFDKKLLGTFALRADRSTKFAYDKGLLVFPSGTIAYRFAGENFMKNLSFINDAKVRIGYGVAGNNRIGDLLYQQLYAANGLYALNHTALPAFTPSSLANPDLKWEKTISQNAGLDLSLFSDRIQFTADVYFNKGKELLLQAAIPSTTGYTFQQQNIGSTSNRGVEFQINATPLRSKALNWSTNFNIAFNRNRVDNLGTITSQTRSAGWQGSDGADDFLVEVGKPVGQMYGFVSDGFYKVDDFNYNATTATYTLKTGVPNNSSIFGNPQPGSLKLRDLDNDGLVTLAGDRQVIGNANAKFSGGWNNQLSYKNFDMSVFINFVYGNDIYNANKIEQTDGSFLNLNMLNIMQNRWRTVNSAGIVVTDPAELTALNANAQIWRPVNNQRYYLHSWAIEDGSFLRVNNVTLGYTFPKQLSQKAGMSSIRFYATVNNLATLTNYSGFDPEVSTRRSDPLTQGVDFAGYPRARTFVFGTNISF
ncbi:TonB-dependent receptor [Pedobacter sp. P351]|uniref:SusC/RagA family TonB-linked outer membrane protein n=1 Tax=Pedobacter superstes TaxID=3133441 RepID=UPI0030AE3700